MTQLRVLFWDVRNGGDRKLAFIERIDADVVLLLAVSRTSARNWSHRWQGRYHCAAALDTVTTNQKRPHGAMIASRWPLQQAEPITELARPERGLTVTIDLDGQPLTLISWGAPNAAGEGYPIKMAAYRHMARLPAAIGHTTILGVDTNSRYDPPDHAAPEQADERRVDEHDFLRRDADHGLRDVHRALIDRDRPRQRLLADLRPDGPLTTIYIRRPRGSPRGIARGFTAGRDFGLDRMDRLFVSPELEPPSMHSNGSPSKRPKPTTNGLRADPRRQHLLARPLRPLAAPMAPYDHRGHTIWRSSPSRYGAGHVESLGRSAVLRSLVTSNMSESL